jgi:hypothetical protein
MRHLPLLFLALAAPAAALETDIPLIALGLPFAPEAPKPVSSIHPLFESISFGEIENLPGSIRFSTARPTTIHNGLRDTLKHMNMLAPSEASAKGRLIVTWVSIEPSGAFVARDTASATLAYRLVRLDNNKTVFERTIRTTVRQSGAHFDSSMSGRRAAIAANFASAAFCLDKASLGAAPADCALQPLFDVRVDRR